MVGAKPLLTHMGPKSMGCGAICFFKLLSDSSAQISMGHPFANNMRCYDKPFKVSILYKLSLAKHHIGYLCCSCQQKQIYAKKNDIKCKAATSQITQQMSLVDNTEINACLHVISCRLKKMVRKSARQDCSAKCMYRVSCLPQRTYV